MVRRTDANNKPNWARSVKSLLCTNGFAEVWFRQGVGDIALFIRFFKERLSDEYKQECSSRISDSSRARFYREIKPLFEYSTYLDIVSCKSHRIALSRFLVSSHVLHIETGRWTRPLTPADRRYCEFCLNKIEDEFHLLLECTKYSDLRSEFIPKYYWKRPSMQKVIELVNTTKKKTLIALAKYLYKAFKLRQDSLTP